MDLRSIYTSNCIGIFILLLLLYISRSRILRRRTEDRLFLFLVLGVLLGCIMEMLSYTIDGKLFPGARVLNYIANTYLFTFNMLLPFCVVVYVDLGLYGDLGRIRKKYRLHIIVGAVMIAVNIVNFFVPVSYCITPENVYERRPFSYVYYFVILFYLVTGIITMRRYERENGAKAFFNIDMFLLPIIVGTGLQFAFYGLSLAWLSSAIGLLGMYMMQQNEMAYLDSLAGTYNRLYLNQILSTWIKRGIPFAGAMLDIDDFKSINDNFGHSEGDRALRTVADTLKQSRLAHEWVFRFAGDEFIVLEMGGSTDALEAYLDEARRRLEAAQGDARPYRICLSQGIAVYDGGDVDAFMRKMDERMYEMKSDHHAAPTA